MFLLPSIDSATSKTLLFLHDSSHLSVKEVIFFLSNLLYSPLFQSLCLYFELTIKSDAFSWEQLGGFVAF